MWFEVLLNLWMNAQIKHENIKRNQGRIKGTQNPGIMKRAKHWEENSNNLLNMFKNFLKILIHQASITKQKESTNTPLKLSNKSEK